MTRAARLPVTLLMFSFWFLTPYAQVWDALVALLLDAPIEDAGGPPPPDNSTDDSDRSAALDPWG